MTRALWLAVGFLALLGVAASGIRALGVLQSHVFSDGPVPELSPFDRGGTRWTATLIGVEPGTEAFRELEDQHRRFLGKFNQFPTATLLHVLPAAVFMVLAPLQFSRRIRSRRIGWHRWSGCVIVAIALPVGLSGLFFGLWMPFSGTLEASAIALFGGVFLFSLIRAFVAIRRRDIATHREWMIRTFSVAIGVSMVRLSGTMLAILTHQGPESWFGTSVWIGFGSTLAVAELWIRRTRRRPAPAPTSVVPA